MECKKTVPATIDNLPSVLQWAHAVLFQTNYSIGELTQIEVAIEEMMMNIISYDYDDHHGNVEVSIHISSDHISIILIDYGKPFDPTKYQKPNLDLAIEERKVGGLGIHLSLEIMDAIDYKRINNQNILTMTKNFLSCQ